MISEMALSSFLFLFYLHSANSNIYIGRVRAASSSLEKCTLTCENAFTLPSNELQISRLECCSRGCRFYGIAALVDTNKSDLKMSRDGCHNWCSESHTKKTDELACNMGCDSMANQRESSVLADGEMSWSFFYEDGDGPHIFQGGEVLDPDDILVDPALRRQLLLNLMVEDTRLPEMRVKTLPVTPDENGGEWWSDCTVRHVGVPRCLAASLLVLLILLAIWFGISCDEKSLMPSPPVLYDPEQAPPLPPKYSLLDDIKV
uniref:WSC domain-containing protein n=1 Tax=Graphocephala atropunctata TaxID=36148 RepID=A0A1B6LT66_9HEMI